MSYPYTKLDSDIAPVVVVHHEAAEFDARRPSNMRSKVFGIILGLLLVGSAASFGAWCTSRGGMMGRGPRAGDEMMAGTASTAVVILKPDAANVSGTITFTQSNPMAPVHITGTIYGIDANAKRGFHIHEFGNLTDGCTSTGSHFNPFQATHGDQSDSMNHRHVGDLGNIQADEDGVAKVDFSDVAGGISLFSVRSIVGRALVVHTGKDDLGRGDDEESLKNGNAGGRAACGIVAVAN